MEHVKVLSQEDEYTKDDIVILRYDDISAVLEDLRECVGVIPPLDDIAHGDLAGWVARAASSITAKLGTSYPVFVPILADNVKDVGKWLKTFYEGGFRHFYLRRYYGRYETDNLLSFINQALKPDAWYHIDGGVVEPKQPVEWGRWSWSSENGHSSQEVP